MKQNYVKVDITKEPAEFRCPHCLEVILTYSRTNPTQEPIPSTCPKCHGEIDNTGVAAYTPNK